MAGLKKALTAQGYVHSCDSYKTRSGSEAHSFWIGKSKYNLYTSDILSPVIEGDFVSFEYQSITPRSSRKRKYNRIIEGSLKVTFPSEHQKDLSGIVYILSNKAMPGLLKIGFTTGTVIDRAADLSRVTGVPTSFKVEWSLPVVGSPKEVEQCAHALLAKNRFGKEFFKVSIQDAIDACTVSYANLYPEHADLMNLAFSERAEKQLLHRQELARQREEKAEQQRQIVEAKAHKLRCDWEMNGLCRLSFRNYNETPNKSKPNFLGKIFGERYIDYVEVSISLSQKEETLIWDLFVDGRRNEKRFNDHRAFEDHGACLEHLNKYLSEIGVSNAKVIISMPNQYMENPPELPNDVRYAPREIMIQSLDGLIFRPLPALTAEAN